MKNDIRISMHPDQFVLINFLDTSVLEQSLRELKYHNEILDLMHVGGFYGDKVKSMARLCERYHNLTENVRGRLVIENDDRLLFKK